MLFRSQQLRAAAERATFTIIKNQATILVTGLPCFIIGSGWDPKIDIFAQNQDPSKFTKADVDKYLTKATKEDRDYLKTLIDNKADFFQNGDLHRHIEVASEPLLENPCQTMWQLPRMS